jgi:hypothetical protein
MIVMLGIGSALPELRSAEKIAGVSPHQTTVMHEIRSAPRMIQMNEIECVGQSVLLGGRWRIRGSLLLPQKLEVPVAHMAKRSSPFG